MQAQSSTTFRDCQLNLKKNGTTYKRCYWYFNNNPIRWIIPNITATMDLSVGDYIEMFIYTQTTDSATTSVTHDSDPESNFGAYKLIT
jgi:predicted RNA-binding protein (virulence factor B family)